MHLKYRGTNYLIIKRLSEQSLIYRNSRKISIGVKGCSLINVRDMSSGYFSSPEL